MQKLTLAERLKRKLPTPRRSKDQRSSRTSEGPSNHVAQSASDGAVAVATTPPRASTPHHSASDEVAAPTTIQTRDSTPALAVPDKAVAPSIAHVGDGKPAPSAVPIMASISSKYLWERAAEALRADEDWKSYCKILREKQLPVPGELANVTVDPTAVPTNPLSMPAKVTAAAEKVKLFYEHNRYLKIGDKSIMVGEVCDKVIAGLSAIKDLGAAATHLNPYASTAWGVIQFLIQIPINRRETLELCWAELPRITRLVSRYQTFEVVYRQEIPISKVMLEESLIKLYTSLLKYQIVIVIYTASKTANFEAMIKDKSRSAVQSLLDEIKKQEDEVARIEALVDHEINSSNWSRLFQVAGDFRVALDALDGSLKDVSTGLDALGLSLKTLSTGLCAISQKVDIMYRERVLQWISPIKYENTHNLPRKTAISATGQWLINHNNLYDKWKKSEDSSTFWLHGFMGSGKSCLAHAVIEDLKVTLHPTNAQLLAYFYCDGTIDEGRSQIESSTNILRSLLKQLSHPGNGELLMTTVVEAYEKNNHKADPTKEQAMDLILSVVQNSKSTVLVIDGLDECPPQVQIDLIKSLGEVVGVKTKGGVKLFISSRRTQLIEDSLKQFEPTAVETAQNNQGDISKLVHLRVKEAADHPHRGKLYWRKGVSREEAVVEKLEQNAQGMFRWVQLALDYIHSTQKYETFTERLAELERLKSLFALYDALYNDMVESSTYQEREAIETLLVFLLYGDRRVEPDDLQGHYDPLDSILSPISEAIAFRRNPDCVDTSSLLTIEDLLLLCPNFVTLDRPNNSSHQGDQRTADHSEDEEFPQILESQASEPGSNLDAQSTTSDYTMDYLDDIGRQPKKPWQGLGIPHFTVREYLVARQASKYCFFQGHAFLAQLCIDIFSHPDIHLRTPDNGLVDYAGRNWAVHLSAIQRDNPGPRGLQPGARGLEVALERSVPLKSKVDAFLSNAKPSVGFVNWSLWFETRRRTDGYYSQTSKFWMGIFRTSCLQPRNGAPRTIAPSPIFASIYLHYGCKSLKMSPFLARLNATGFISRSDRYIDVLEYAVMTGNVDAINALLETGQSTERPRKRGGAPANLYYWALKVGSAYSPYLADPIPWLYIIEHYDAVAILGTLAKNGIDPNFRDDKGRTPLLWALSASDRYPVEGRLNLAKLLLEKGADPNLVGKDGRSPLFNALYTYQDGMGPEFSAEQRLNIAKLLIEHGADPSMNDTPSRPGVLQQILRTDCVNNLAIIEYLSPLALGTGMDIIGYGRAWRKDHYETLFHKVARSCSEDTIRCWIDHGANPFAPTITCNGEGLGGLVNLRYGPTPIDFARDAGREKIVDYLSSLHPPPHVPPPVPNCEYCELLVLGDFYSSRQGGEYYNVCKKCICRREYTGSFPHGYNWIDLPVTDPPTRCMQCRELDKGSSISRISQSGNWNFCASCIKSDIDSGKHELWGRNDRKLTRRIVQNGCIESNENSQICIYCAEEIEILHHYHCHICGDGDFLFCTSCVGNGVAIYCNCNRHMLLAHYFHLPGVDWRQLQEPQSHLECEKYPKKRFDIFGPVNQSSQIDSPSGDESNNESQHASSLTGAQTDTDTLST